MKAAFAREKILPSGPVELAGYDLRTALSTGVLDDIYVNALALASDAGERLLLLSFDLLGVPIELCACVKCDINAKTGLDEDRIWLSATHTHAAPRAIFNRQDGDAAYIEILRKAALAASERALNDLRPVSAYGGGAGISGIASLRDVPRERSLCQMPLRRFVLSQDGGNIELIRFACHPTVLSESNTLISRDLAGALKQEEGILLNGACGDLSTRYTRVGEGITELERQRQALKNAIKSIECKSAPGFCAYIKAKTACVTLPWAAPLRPERKAELISAHEARLKTLADEAAKRELISIIAVLRRPPKKRDSERTVTVSAVDLGECVLLGLPFEVNSGDGTSLEDELRAEVNRKVLLVCYTNGYEGYLPSGKPIDETSSYQDVAASLAPEARLMVMDAAKRIIYDLTEENK